MKRFLALALFVASSSFGLVGCSEKSSETVTATKNTPDGDVKTKTTTETTKTGDQRDAR